MESAVEKDARHAERERRKFANLSGREWLSLQQAANYAGYSEGAFSRYVKDGTAPRSVKLTHAARRFRRVDVDSWIAGGGPAQHKAGACNGH